ncbi:hypothetical protein A9958_12940 (plasmid) [Staphylococcus simulans]|uniref:hypothetical protein n=1 Tax=Staphylococcus simulans TaxID=1286 RepID=UPI000D0A4A1D|nr:hypothetical protein [Staphylococcus simulans]AVO03350.1 hypothetical protein BI282_12935 [Staphylococcus simulans]AVO06386.1 hypothetical protein BI283_13440 [Staphylococcus simulans]AWG19898.1 hypothetical protein A9958_12940 [Staphylococcus simulans]AWI02928.1 hypothetical protein A7X73_13315 [Staphylococcus simulans]MEB6838027.1 hypothetical protein [Staphylococcus simulans]
MDSEMVSSQIKETEEKIRNLSKKAMNQKNNMKTTQSYTNYFKQINILENRLKGLKKLQQKLK